MTVVYVGVRKGGAVYDDANRAGSGLRRIPTLGADDGMAHVAVGMSTQDAWRRWFGLLFLVIAGGMTTWGLLVLDARLRGWWFVFYWTACLVFVLLAMGVAILDWLIMRRRGRDARANLAREVFGKTRRTKQDPVQGDPGNGSDGASRVAERPAPKRPPEEG